MKTFSIPLVGLAFATGAAWGQSLQAPGLPHLQQVTGNIYRGAQPNNLGWGSLANMGVKIVIDLRREGEDGEHSTAAEAQAVEALGMRYVHVPMKGLSAPSDAQMNKVLALLTSGEKVFVHCKKGKDRTGTVIACYRISNQGWQNRKALDEAKSLGMHWIEVGMKNYILGYRAPVIPAVDAAAPAAAAVQ